MRALLVTFALLAAAPAAAGTLDRAIAAAQPGNWIEYRVPRVAGIGSPCCATGTAGRPSTGACALDDPSWQLNDDAADADGQLRVFVRVGDAGVDRVRAFGAECPVDLDDAEVSPVAVTPAESVAWLASHAQRGGNRGRDDAIAALGLHASTEATGVLGELAGAPHPDAVRRAAWFWLARARGETGFRAVRDALRDEADDDLRRHLVFALTVSPEAAAGHALIATARDDRDAGIRGEALFWLAQDGDPRAETEIRRSLVLDTARQTRKKAVFALSQLPPPRALQALMAILEDREGDPEIRREAMFWLAQIDDPSVFAALDRILADGRAR